MKKTIRNELLYEILLFTSAVFFLVMFWNHNMLLAVLLLILYLIGNRTWHRKHDSLFFIIGAILGPFSEIIAVYFGIWTYTNPTFLGIPLWLPFAWGLVSLLIVRIAETFVKIQKR